MKNLIILVMFFLVNASLSAQVFTTPTTVNMSKSYLPFNKVTVNLDKSEVTISSLKNEIVFKITKLDPPFQAQAKIQKYYVDAKNDLGEKSAFSFIIANGEIVRFAQFVGSQEDWVLSK